VTSNVEEKKGYVNSCP